MTPRSAIVVVASLLAVAPACGSDGGAAPLGSASSSAPAARASPSVSTADLDARKRGELLRQLGEVEDEPDLVPAAPGPTPSEASVDLLLRGGAFLETLPVRSTDPGRSFDRHLPARLKPAHAPAEGARPRRCDPLDPLCDDP